MRSRCTVTEHHPSLAPAIQDGIRSYVCATNFSCKLLLPLLLLEMRRTIGMLGCLENLANITLSVCAMMSCQVQVVWTVMCLLTVLMWLWAWIAVKSARHANNFPENETAERLATLLRAVAVLGFAEVPKSLNPCGLVTQTILLRMCCSFRFASVTSQHLLRQQTQTNLP